MAQVINCDADDCTESADLLMTNLNNGEVQAFCNGHFSEMVFAMATAMIEHDAEQNGQTLDDLPPGENTTDDGNTSDTGADADKTAEPVPGTAE